MADKEKKREENIIQKFELSQEPKELFRWKKKHLSKFLKGYYLVKIKTLLKNSELKLLLLTICFAQVDYLYLYVFNNIFIDWSISWFTNFCTLITFIYTKTIK